MVSGVFPLRTFDTFAAARTRLATLAVVALVLCAGLLAPARAHAATPDELKAQLSDASTKLDGMMSQANDAMTTLKQTQDAIAETQELIDQTRDSLNEKHKEVASMQRDYATLIVNDYKNSGDLGLFAFILGAKDFEDLVSRVYYTDRISMQKERALTDLRNTQDEMMNTQRELQGKKEELEGLAAQQESQVSELQSAMDSQQAYVNSLPSEIQAALDAEYAASREKAQKEAEQLIDHAGTDVDPRNVNKVQKQETEEPKQESTSSDEGSDEGSNDSGSSNNGGGSSRGSSPQSQPADSSGGHLSDVANYIGPQAGWSGDAGYIAAQQSILNNAGSGTNWGCVVDTGSGRCVVFRRDGGVWKAAMTTNVITNGHTFTGDWTVVFHSRAYWKLPDGYDVNDWWVCFIEAWSGDDYNGHLRYEAGKGYDDGQGFHFGYSTGGCTVIDNYATAQWLYDHVPDGSRVVVY